ncbi:MAG: VWA domain-containing protein [Duncaniella sp.]|nr:VWA domain-containing protein [Duncaniella sp.]
MSFFSNFGKSKPAPVPDGVKRVFNLMILDASGSMVSIYESALTGVNETLQTIRATQGEHGDQAHFVTLVTFNSTHYGEIYSATPANEAKDITPKQYIPSGCTPLFDAMGRAITSLQSTVADGDIVLVTVITDGMENASREYSRDTIKKLVESLKAKGWMFTYIGANQDVDAVADSLAIKHRLAFNANASGTSAMFNIEARARKRFFDKVGYESIQALIDEDYFDEPNP